MITYLLPIRFKTRFLETKIHPLDIFFMIISPAKENLSYQIIHICIYAFFLHNYYQTHNILKNTKMGNNEIYLVGKVNL